MNSRRLESGAQVVLIGAGGHAVVVSEAVRALGANVVGYVSPTKGSERRIDAPWLGDDDTFINLPNPPSRDLVLGVGLLTMRSALSSKYSEAGFAFPALVHPRACIAESVQTFDGVQVMAGAIVQPFAVLNAHVLVNTGAVVEHDCTIGAYCHVAPGAILLGGASLGQGCFIGGGAVVLPRVQVGEGAIVGAGSVVTAEVPPRTMVYGIPAVPRVSERDSHRKKSI